MVSCTVRSDPTHFSFPPASSGANKITGPEPDASSPPLPLQRPSKPRGLCSSSGAPFPKPYLPLVFCSHFLSFSATEDSKNSREAWARLTQQSSVQVECRTLASTQLEGMAMSQQNCSSLRLYHFCQGLVDAQGCGAAVWGGAWAVSTR